MPLLIYGVVEFTGDETMSFESNMNLVHAVLRQMNLLGDKEYEDLVQEGSLGLVKACDTYDPSKGFKFSTYACICIRNNILMYLRKLQRQSKLRTVSFDTPIKNSRNPQESTRLSDLIEDPGSSVECKVATSLLVEALKSECPKYKYVLRLTYEGYNQREIGERLGVSKSYVSRIQSKLYSKYKEEFL